MLLVSSSNAVAYRQQKTSDEKIDFGSPQKLSTGFLTIWFRFMPRLSSSMRIVQGLVSLTISALLVAGLLGLIPNVGTAAQKNRSAFCEATAVSVMALAPRMNEKQIQETFDAIRQRNPEVESLAVRTESHCKSWSFFFCSESRLTSGSSRSG